MLELGFLNNIIENLQGAVEKGMDFLYKKAIFYVSRGKISFDCQGKNSEPALSTPCIDQYYALNWVLHCKDGVTILLFLFVPFVYSFI